MKLFYIITSIFHLIVERKTEEVFRYIEELKQEMG